MASNRQKSGYLSKPHDLQDAAIEEGYETPTFDTLKNQHRTFLVAFLRCNCFKTAALEAGFSKDTAYHRGWALSRSPTIVKAMDELVEKEMLHVEAQRCQVIVRLTADSMVSLEDLTYFDAESGKYKIRSPEDISDAYRRCLGMVQLSREGCPVFNNAAQNAARKLLAEYTGWSKSEVHSVPPISFDFGGMRSSDDDKDKKGAKPAKEKDE